MVTTDNPVQAGLVACVNFNGRVPCEIVADCRHEVVIRFAAGNMRSISLDQLEPATLAEVTEFNAARATWSRQ